MESSPCNCPLTVNVFYRYRSKRPQENMGEDNYCFTKNELNFFRVCFLATKVLPEELRPIFIEQWNLLYSQRYGNWCNTPKNGQDFFSMESNSNKKRNKEMLNIMQSGDVEQWDCTMLFYGLLYSSSIGANLNPEVHTHVNNLREFRNKSFAHVSKGEVTSSDFQIILNKLLQALLGLGRDTSPVKKVQNLSSFSTDEVCELREKLENEKMVQLDFERRLCNLEDRVLNLEKKSCPSDAEEEYDYSRIAQLSINKNKPVGSHFLSLPNKLNHPVIPRRQVDEVIKTLNDLEVIHADKITSVVVVGEPLSGKTECVRQIGHALSSHKSIVAALQCGSYQTFASSLKQLAQTLGYSQENFPSLYKASLSSQIEMISLFLKEKLSDLPSWVIILDGVTEDNKELLNYLPKPGEQGNVKIFCPNFR